ncbi:MAG TPA: SRPBCC domain-containing protein [Cytophagaceae bacterium]|jgi:uncharacterized protein YndB with AHSA1/START domain|nr:SRPBCC domain-containing protein [Cytophagaceae bacterium]
MTSEINHIWLFNKSPQEVWDYLTKPELLEQWLAKTDFQPIVGHKFYFIGKNNCLTHCEVLEVKPYTQLSYSWQANTANDNKRFDSTVVWKLVPKENGTELHLVHHGFISIEDYTGHKNGWTILINGLIEHLNTIKK